jgi:hypothetical protein
MSSQGPVGANRPKEIQGDSSNWTQLLKRRKIYRGLLNNFSDVRADLIQSNQLQTDYRIGVSGCGLFAPYPRLRTGQGC